MVRKRRTTPKPDPSVRSGIRPPVDASHVRLERGVGSPGRGAGAGGAYWTIYVGDVRAGTVFINVIDEPPIGPHASIQIKINKPWQGRGVGRRAYALASDASGHDVVYAHMRKANVASAKAAEHAGYTQVDDLDVRQLLMVWHRASHP